MIRYIAYSRTFPAVVGVLTGLSLVTWVPVVRAFAGFHWGVNIA